MKFGLRIWTAFLNIVFWLLLASPALAGTGAVVSSQSYINGTALTTHTTSPFNSTGASTLVAFVSTNNPWNGAPVNITGISDNMGNAWQLLTGPTLGANSSFPMLSAIYYVNAPATSSQYTVTAHLSNGAPVVMHIFAISGSDVSSAPAFSPITDPGQSTSSDVASQTIAASAGSVLLGWVRTWNGEAETALSGFTLDAAQSNNFLAAESQPVSTTGNYASHFSLSNVDSWQTAIVAVKTASSQPSTNTSVVSSANPSVYGQPVTFTATVNTTSSGSATPAGTVSFKDGSTVLATATPSTNNGVTSVTYTTSALSVGSHQITVTYSGDVNFNGSTSTPITEIVNQAFTSTALGTSANPSAVGQPVTFTATVSAVAPGNGIPSGTVQFKIDGASFGSVAVDNTGTATSSPMTTLVVGNHTVAAIYSGDSNFAGSDNSASPLLQAVNQVSTTTSIASSSDPSVFGQSVTLTATVSSSLANIAPTGTVTFNDGSTILGTSAVSTNGAIATATFATTLGTGPHSIVAVYSGDTSFTSSSSPTLSQTVNPATQNITVTSTVPSSESYNASFNLSATGGASTSAVIFTVDSSSTACSIGTVTNSNGAFTAAVTMTSGTGNCVIDLNQSATANYSAAKQVQVIVTAAKANASALTILGPASLTYGSTGTATVSGGGGTGPITFSAATSTGCSVTETIVSVTNASGSCLLVATQAADNNYSQTTSAAFAVTLNKATIGVTLASSATPVTAGQSITLSATLNNAGATGTVTFFDGTTALGTGTVSAGNASFTTSSLAAGTHSLTAKYGGDSNFLTGTSPAIAEVVNAKSTTTQLTSSQNPSAAGQLLTLTATVTGSGTPSGSVTFKDGSTILGTVSLGNGQATLTTSSLLAGTHTLIAAYGGDAMFAASTSTTVSQTVTGNVATTVSTPSSSLNPSTYGQSVTLTSSVTGAGGTPTGTLLFYDNGTLIGTATLSGASGSVATTALNAGSHSITAVYSGDTTFASNTSAALIQNVNPASTTAAFGLNVAQQQYSDLVTYTATLKPTSGQLPSSAGVVFKMGSQPLNTTPVPLTLVNGVPTATLTNSPLLESTAGEMKPGLHTVTATFTGMAGNFTTTNVSKSLSIIQEDARTFYAGPATVSTGSSTVSAATIPLHWTIKDITALPGDPVYDANPGDITLAQVTFINRATGATIATVPVTLVPNPNNPNDRTVGVATYNWSVDIGSATSQTYTVGTSVTGYYTRNSATENATITVTKP